MDTDLVVRAQAGDRGAFAALVDEILDRDLAIAHRILRDGALAEDATQAALLSIWRDLPKLRDPDRFGPWSTRVLVNACYSEARRARRWQPIVAIESIPEPAAPDELDAIIDRDQLERGFRDVPIEQRAVLVLHHYAGMPIEAVARALDVPVGTVRSRMHRGMTSIRETLSHDERVSRQPNAPEAVP